MSCAARRTADSASLAHAPRVCLFNQRHNCNLIPIVRKCQWKIGFTAELFMNTSTCTCTYLLGSISIIGIVESTSQQTLSFCPPPPPPPVCSLSPSFSSPHVHSPSPPPPSLSLPSPPLPSLPPSLPLSLLLPQVFDLLMGGSDLVGKLASNTRRFREGMKAAGFNLKVGVPSVWPRPHVTG